MIGFTPTNKDSFAMSKWTNEKRIRTFAVPKAFLSIKTSKRTTKLSLLRLHTVGFEERPRTRIKGTKHLEPMARHLP